MHLRREGASHIDVYMVRSGFFEPGNQHVELVGVAEDYLGHYIESLIKFRFYAANVADPKLTSLNAYERCEKTVGRAENIRICPAKQIVGESLKGRYKTFHAQK